MARLFDLTAGELRELERIMNERLSAEDARRIIRHPEVFDQMVRSISIAQSVESKLQLRRRESKG